ncbi:MAG: RNA polymerase subunit sigma-24 [Phycisphaeraceae bacterium]|nr:RNA polymerase subunit sigma-24 [Phycisphaeraceae bacterium]
MSDPSNRHAQWILAAVDEYEAPLNRFATRMLVDADLAREAVQDTFLALCREASPPPTERLKQWLYKVCQNRCVDLIRRHRPTAPLEASSAPARQRDPAEQAEHRESVDRVRSAVDELPPRQRELVLLKFEHEMSYRQMSEITGLSVSNVGYQLHVALATIRERLG